MHLDAEIPERERLKRLYRGEIFVFSPNPVTVTLCEYVRSMPSQEEKLFRDPCVKEFLRRVLGEFHCDLTNAYLDIPRLPAAAGHPHRDTWYAAPPMQINWRIAGNDAKSSLTFYPTYWSRSIGNNSSRFNYYDTRDEAAQEIKALEPLRTDSCLHLIPAPGQILMFSAAHLYATFPNAFGHDRCSIDFRTVHVDDVITHRGAFNMDAHPTGTSLRTFKRACDFQRLPEEIILPYDERRVTLGRFLPAFTPAAN